MYITLFEQNKDIFKSNNAFHSKHKIIYWNRITNLVNLNKKFIKKKKIYFNATKIFC